MFGVKPIDQIETNRRIDSIEILLKILTENVQGGFQSINQAFEKHESSRDHAQITGGQNPVIESGGAQVSDTFKLQESVDRLGASMQQRLDDIEIKLSNQKDDLQPSEEQSPAKKSVAQELSDSSNLKESVDKLESIIQQRMDFELAHGNQVDNPQTSGATALAETFKLQESVNKLEAMIQKRLDDMEERQGNQRVDRQTPSDTEVANNSMLQESVEKLESLIQERLDNIEETLTKQRDHQQTPSDTDSSDTLKLQESVNKLESIIQQRMDIELARSNEGNDPQRTVVADTFKLQESVEKLEVFIQQRLDNMEEKLSGRSSDPQTPGDAEVADRFKLQEYVDKLESLIQERLDDMQEKLTKQRDHPQTPGDTDSSDTFKLQESVNKLESFIQRRLDDIEATLTNQRGDTPLPGDTESSETSKLQESVDKLEAIIHQRLDDMEEKLSNPREDSKTNTTELSDPFNLHESFDKFEAIIQQRMDDMQVALTNQRDGPQTSDAIESNNSQLQTSVDKLESIIQKRLDDIQGALSNQRDNPQPPGDTEFSNTVNLQESVQKLEAFIERRLDGIQVQLASQRDDLQTRKEQNLVKESSTTELSDTVKLQESVSKVEANIQRRLDNIEIKLTNPRDDTEPSAAIDSSQTIKLQNAVDKLEAIVQQRLDNVEVKLSNQRDDLWEAIMEQQKIMDEIPDRLQTISQAERDQRKSDDHGNDAEKEEKGALSRQNQQINEIRELLLDMSASLEEQRGDTQVLCNTASEQESMLGEVWTTIQAQADTPGIPSFDTTELKEFIQDSIESLDIKMMDIIAVQAKDESPSSDLKEFISNRIDSLAGKLKEDKVHLVSNKEDGDEHVEQRTTRENMEGADRKEKTSELEALSKAFVQQEVSLGKLHEQFEALSGRITQNDDNESEKMLLKLSEQIESISGINLGKTKTVDDEEKQNQENLLATLAEHIESILGMLAKAEVAHYDGKQKQDIQLEQLSEQLEELSKLVAVNDEISKDQQGITASLEGGDHHLAEVKDQLQAIKEAVKSQEATLQSSHTSNSENTSLLMEVKGMVQQASTQDENIHLKDFVNNRLDALETNLTTAIILKVTDNSLQLQEHFDQSVVSSLKEIPSSADNEAQFELQKKWGNMVEAMGGELGILRESVTSQQNGLRKIEEEVDFIASNLRSRAVSAEGVATTMRDELSKHGQHLGELKEKLRILSESEEEGKRERDALQTTISASENERSLGLERLHESIVGLENVLNHVLEQIVQTKKQHEEETNGLSEQQAQIVELKELMLVALENLKEGKSDSILLHSAITADSSFLQALSNSLSGQLQALNTTTDAQVGLLKQLGVEVKEKALRDRNSADIGLLLESSNKQQSVLFEIMSLLKEEASRNEDGRLGQVQSLMQALKALSEAQVRAQEAQKLDAEMMNDAAVGQERLLTEMKELFKVLSGALQAQVLADKRHESSALQALRNSAEEREIFLKEMKKSFESLMETLQTQALATGNHENSVLTTMNELGQELSGIKENMSENYDDIWNLLRATAKGTLKGQANLKEGINEYFRGMLGVLQAQDKDHKEHRKVFKSKMAEQDKDLGEISDRLHLLSGVLEEQKADLQSLHDSANEHSSDLHEVINVLESRGEMLEEQKADVAFLCESATGQEGILAQVLNLSQQQADSLEEGKFNDGINEKLASQGGSLQAISELQLKVVGRLDELAADYRLHDGLTALGTVLEKVIAILVTQSERGEQTRTDIDLLCSSATTQENLLTEIHARIGVSRQEEKNEEAVAASEMGKLIIDRIDVLEESHAAAHLDFLQSLAKMLKGDKSETLMGYRGVPVEGETALSPMLVSLEKSILDRMEKVRGKIGKLNENGYGRF